MDLYLAMCIVKVLLVLALVIEMGVLLSRTPAPAKKAGFSATSPGASKDLQFEKSISGFFPSGGSFPIFTQTPNQDVLNNYIYGERGDITKAERDQILSPLLLKLNSGAYSGSSEERAEKLADDILIAGSLGAVRCADGRWVADKDFCKSISPAVAAEAVAGMKGDAFYTLASR
jgi:hypothetical protein